MLLYSIVYYILQNMECLELTTLIDTMYNISILWYDRHRTVRCLHQAVDRVQR